MADIEWITRNGTLGTRDVETEENLLKAYGTCDDCIHPVSDHDYSAFDRAGKIGACWRINPTHGPCPCKHTSPGVRAEQERIFNDYRRTQANG